MTTPETQPVVTVSLVNYNTRDLTLACIASLYETVRAPMEIIVADNASTDGTMDEVERRFPGVIAIRNPQNLGFGYGVYQAQQSARGKYFLFLNTDTVAPPGAIDHLVEFLEKNPRAGAAAPQLRYGDGSLQHSIRRFPTLEGMAFLMLYLDRLLPQNHRIGQYMMRDFDYEHPAEVDQPMGACLLFRKTALDQAGGIDTRFFMYFEEVDLCLRVRHAGWEIHYLPEVHVIHYENKSSEKSWSRTHLWFYESMMRYFRKHAGPAAAHKLRALIYVGAAARVSAWALMAAQGRLSPSEAMKRVRTYRELVQNLHRW